jgi:serine/threonine protein kinase
MMLPFWACPRGEAEMPPNEPTSRDDRVNLAIATYLAAVERGEAPDHDEFLADHGDVAAELKSFLLNQSWLRHAALRDGTEHGAPADESASLWGQTDTYQSDASSPIDQRESARNGDISVLPKGTTIGRYIVERCLGRGGFGAVYLARDDELQRSVAVKVPRLEKSASSQRVEQMLQEARTVAQLQHPGIVSVFDSGRTPDGNPYFVMEYVTGRSLEELLKCENLTTEQSVRLVVDIADATHFLHLRCFVHRDLKPGNVLIGADGRPRLSDFGMALHENQQRARAGECVGTLPYMSPEQLRGEAHRVDGRTDIWSLGVIFYRLLTGRLPFGGHTPAQLVDEILNRDPKPLRQIDDRIPAELEAVCLKCLSKNPTNRYNTGADVAQALHGYLEKAAVPLRSPSQPVEPAQKRIELKTRMGNYGCSVSMALTVCLLTAIIALSLGWPGPPRSDLSKHSRPAVVHPVNVSDVYSPERVFELLDTDKDGQISEDEFKQSALARLIFKDAATMPGFPISRTQFLESYPRQQPDPRTGDE